MALVLAALAPASPAHAQTSAASGDASNLTLARSVAVTGREAFNAGDYETALALFRRAYRLFPAPTVGLYEARTLERMGLLLEAVDAFARTTRLVVADGAPAQFAEAVAAARSEGELLRARIPVLTIEIRGAELSDPSLRVRINGRSLAAAQVGLAQSLNPGSYRIEGSLVSGRSASADVTLVPGQARRIVLNLAAPMLNPTAASSETDAFTATESAAPLRRPVPFWAYVAGGVGVTGVSAGVITGLMANGKHDDAERLCEDHRCAPGSPGLDAVDAFRTWRMISSVSYGVGAVGIATGVVLWLTASDKEGTGRVGTIEPWGTAKTAGIRGTF